MSRIEDSSIVYRRNLEARNFYTPENPYELDNSKLVDTINVLAGVLKPFSSFELTNTVLYRLIGNNNSPIAQTGLIMLGKQMAYNVASNISQEYLPTLNFSNLFDGDPSTKLFTNKVDFQITRNNPRGSITEIMNDIIGRTPPRSTLASLNVGTIKYDGVENIPKTGKGQLQILTSQVNYNLYKNSNPQFNSSLEAQKLSLRSGTELIRQTLLPTQGYLYPFDQYKTPLGDSANFDYYNNLVSYYSQSNFQGNAIHEYGVTQQSIDDLGDTIINKNNNASGEYIINSDDFGMKTDFTNQLVWGRDGVSREYKNDRILDDSSSFDFDRNNNRWGSFGAKIGILEYTRQLLNSKGKYASFDITKKNFQDTSGNLHFNGSPLDTQVDGVSNYSRRHSAADPYNRFAKAIRFNGNQMYGGNPNSVVYQSVLPKIHPVLKGNKVDNTNLMFSIENLALQATPDYENNLGYLNDPLATNIPLCEVGPAGGRIMWFPPYDVKLSEQAVARWENTNFIGRGEPIYTYSNSERLANLSFKLLIDYPPQVRDYRDRAEYQKVIAEFFAFGGDGSKTNIEDVSKLIKKREDLENQLKNIKPKKKLVDPKLPFGTSIEFYFPNDLPKEANAAGTGVDYVLSLGYENGITDPSQECDKDWGLNAPFLGLIDSQIQQFLNPEPNAALEDGTTYSNIDYVNIELVGSATKLFNPTKGEAEYNLKLSERRIQAVINYINQRFKAIFGTNKTPADFGVKFLTNPLGSTQSSEEFSTTDSICKLGAKEERMVKFTFVHKGTKQYKEVPITIKERENQEQITEDIIATDKSIANTKKNAASYSQCVFEVKNDEDGISKGFKPMLTDKFQQVFHSQTPEDFHKRLTFLQQCVRQGPAVRTDGTGVESGKNSVFGRQPFCILRIGDFFHTKVIIDNISFSYEETTWDTNPEGMGMQPMIADISMSLRVIGGQSLKTPIEAIQNAASFNYYANSTFYTEGEYYQTASDMESLQVARNSGDVKTFKSVEAEIRARGAERNTKRDEAIKRLTEKNSGEESGG